MRGIARARFASTFLRRAGNRRARTSGPCESTPCAERARELESRIVPRRGRTAQEWRRRPQEGFDSDRVYRATRPQLAPTREHAKAPAALATGAVSTSANPGVRTSSLGSPNVTQCELSRQRGRGLCRTYLTITQFAPSDPFNRPDRLAQHSRWCWLGLRVPFKLFSRMAGRMKKPLPCPALCAGREPHDDRHLYPPE